jgi:hypothetical protein
MKSSSLCAKTLAGGYVQADETPIDYLEPGHGSARKGYLWAYGPPGGDVLFDWQTSRAATCLEKVITADFTGTIQCDGYSAYGAFARGHKGKITLAGCWAHVRRKFHEALDQAPRTTAWLLGQIGHLYRIERKLREQRAGPQLRAAIHAWQSRPIQERIRRALIRLKSSHRHLPQSLPGRAIDYALSQWPTLGTWLEDGRVEIDNRLLPASTHPLKGAKRGPKPKLALEDRLLMLLMYYREYRTFAHVGAGFGVSEAQSWRVVTEMEARLLKGGALSSPPQAEPAQPDALAKRGRGCGRVRLRAAKKKQRACYSGKKKRHTLKAQVLLERGTRRILAVRMGKGRGGTTSPLQAEPEARASPRAHARRHRLSGLAEAPCQHPQAAKSDEETSLEPGAEARQPRDPLPARGRRARHPPPQGLSPAG